MTGLGSERPNTLRPSGTASRTTTLAAIAAIRPSLGAFRGRAMTPRIQIPKLKMASMAAVRAWVVVVPGQDLAMA